MQKVQSETGETEFQSTHRGSELAYLKFRFADCPVKTTLGVLGKKWSMLVLRDIGIYKKERFNRLLESIPGITPRVLATRLKELEAAGLIKIVEKKDSPMLVRWALTEKGIDSIPILMMVAAFGSKYEAEKVFADKKPRKLGELFNREAIELLQRFL